MSIEESIEIPTPVWKSSLAFHEGGIVKFYGPMECSKTRTMIAVLFELLKSHYYLGNQVFANCWLDIPGSHWLHNEELRSVLSRAFNFEVGKRQWNRCIFLIMEADDVYSHITQSDKECYQDLKRASQSFKRNMYLLYEVHEGKAVPKYLRDKTEISVRPYCFEKEDRLELLVCNGHYGTTNIIPVEHISRVNDRYRRFDELY